MKIRMQHKMTFEEADQLIERYYDGLTRVEEERQLKEFLLQPNLPSRYEPEQAIFGYFKPQSEKQRFSIRPLMSWAAVAAILLVGIFSIQIFIPEVHTSHAYVDGTKITDINEIKLQAMSTLNDIPSGNGEVEKSINDLNNKDIIKQQLETFVTFE
ncbi:hypothetical protein SDC9_80229 [bioreactor metagenome]|uniref:Uncharacterized protein n=1 Tax=bioreactor metagenome TaxID=1076179 RepID=A0A644YYU7_9ZZZZ|nr:hypothetical protein [Paludibacter sp.]